MDRDARDQWTRMRENGRWSCWPCPAAAVASCRVHRSSGRAPTRPVARPRAALSEAGCAGGGGHPAPQ
jgi:hypothetical protein